MHKRTVRCSFCRQKGHNKKSCPELRQWMQSRLEANPEDWRAKEFFKRKKLKVKRQCSYCDKTGHNRATCKELKYAKGITQDLARRWRAKVSDVLADAGLGIGTLVGWERLGNGTSQGIVTAINWQLLNHKYLTTYYDVKPLIVMHLNSRGQPHNTHCSLPALPALFEKQLISPRYAPFRSTSVLSRISSDVVRAQYPATWLSGEDCLERLFTKETRPSSVSDWVELQGFYED